MKSTIKDTLDFYKNKKVLVTGHTGIKGAWLSCVLYHLGADSVGYALAPETGCLYEKINGNEIIKSAIGDICDEEFRDFIKSIQPEIIIHLAAFAYVNECFNDPLKTYRTNVLGTVNLLEGIRECGSVKSVVIVSTDKVYENKDDGKVYKETDTIGGDSPYGCSKTCMDMIVQDYIKSYFSKRDLGVVIVRPSNVLAGGDHVVTRLIPSILKSVDEGVPVEIRNPNQTRPWQSVFDALDGYLTLARLSYDCPKRYSGPWNVGPMIDGIQPVGWIVDKIKGFFHGVESVTGNNFDVRESETLGLDIEKILKETNWKPRMTLDDTIKSVVDFYKRQKQGDNPYNICMDQIKDYYQK